jgi:hypothetical protein
MARGGWRRSLSSRLGSANGAAGYGSADDELPWGWELLAQRRAAWQLQRLKAAHAEDSGGRVGVDGLKDRDGQFQTEFFDRYRRS